MHPDLRSPLEPDAVSPDAGEVRTGRQSKTRRKKEMHELQSLGEKLVELNPVRLAAIELPSDLRDAVVEARGIKSFEGRRRQMQFIGRLMREVDAAPIRERLAAWNGQSREQAALEHEIARWRERLIDDDRALTEFASAHAGTDIQRLRALARNARAEREAGRAPRNYRGLYRALRSAMGDAPAIRRQAEDES